MASQIPGPLDAEVEEMHEPSVGPVKNVVQENGYRSEKQADPLLQFLLCAISTVEGADMVLLPSVFFALQRDLHLSLNDLATMTLFQALCQAAAAPFWGVLADRGILTRKTILVFGSVSQGVVTGILAGVDRLVPMILLRSLNGALLASLRPVCNGVLADVTSEARRGKAYGWIFFSLNVGMVLGSLIATPLSTRIVLGLQGWRVAFVLVGLVSALVGAIVAVCMTEPEREGAKLAEQRQKGVFSELQRLWGYCQMPTFLALVLQGCFGCVPWNAMSYRTLFFQVGGLSDFQASLLQALGQGASAFGALFGGMLADLIARRYLPLHGRPLVAQVSVLLGIPITYFTFMVVPPSGVFWYYLFLVCFLGFTASWCATGVNLPILSEIVPADNRSAVMA